MSERVLNWCLLLFLPVTIGLAFLIKWGVPRLVERVGPRLSERIKCLLLTLLFSAAAVGFWRYFLPSELSNLRDLEAGRIQKLTINMFGKLMYEIFGLWGVAALDGFLGIILTAWAALLWYALVRDWNTPEMRQKSGKG